MEIIYAILVIVAGFFIEFKVFEVVKMFGHLDWAEKYLGAGGSYMAWRLLGVILIIGGFWKIGSAL